MTKKNLISLFLLMTCLMLIMKKDWKAGNLDDQEFLYKYKETVKKMNKFFEEMSLVQAELEVFHTKKNG